MKLKYRSGNINDLDGIKQLANKSWGIFRSMLSSENWEILHNNLNNDQTYKSLFNHSDCIVCTTEDEKIIGMTFLVPSGNPTDIFDKDWSHIRFLSVDPDFGGQGIGRQLILKCIDLAKSNCERTIALHTSEMMDKARHIYESLGFKILRELGERFGKKYWLYKLDI
ncbi:MAG: GNAT family N-acetyltransferase [Sporocytophaga sp.]|uniref:GNAT family N-acetyltransferase n=1 Tax=Sporocytophaga sp. TaxID=2231183 RepID=UPI001B1BCE46|nr:GNAT family N-acetyltransferase [Sporocytophaga sp.]MBO9702351.1 GNAT family N-acetyltransferase [Sporocytophaga sp.]